MDLYHGTCSRENWSCKKCSGCPTEHVFHSLPCTGLFNLLWFCDKAVFGLLFTNWNTALQIPHKLQSNIVLQSLRTTKYLHSKQSIKDSVFHSKVSNADHTRVAQYIMISKFIIQYFYNSNFHLKLLTHTLSWILVETVSSEILQNTEFTVPRPES